MKFTLRIVLIFTLLKVLLHCLSAETLGFHRDELLYLALGRHLDWGYWSNPPLIGLISWLGQHTLGDALWATRFLPALCGGAFMGIVLLMVRELGGGTRALIGCGVAMLGSLAWLRTFSMLQPVPFDVFLWTLPQYFLLRWLNTRDPRWWWALGVGVGLGMLNKYTLLFFGSACFLALMVSAERKVLLTRHPWMAAGVALLLLAPNLLWQWQHDFPIVHHMQELKRNQLVHVQPLHFLLDQLMFHGAAVLIWGAGLFALLRSSSLRPYRVMGYFYVAVLLVFLITSGKSYYTLGAYPVLFAAGSVFWEKTIQRLVGYATMTAGVLLLQLPLLPYGIPIAKLEQLLAYFQRVPIEGALRWEDGEQHPLPQDYADMLGWPELGGLVDSALVRSGAPENCLVYGENYGQAGAAERFSRLHGVGQAVSFSDSYLLWAPHHLPEHCNTLIYINDELGEDVQILLSDIQLIGSISNPLAREYGTSVWLCRRPRSPFPAFWAERVTNQ